MVTSIDSAATILYFLPLGGVLKADEYNYFDYSGYDDCMDSLDAYIPGGHDKDEADEICSEENQHLDGWQIRVSLYARISGRYRKSGQPRTGFNFYSSAYFGQSYIIL